MPEVKIELLHDNLNGFLDVPPDSKALVIFVHGSGSSRFSRRNQYLANFLNDNGFATLLIDLLTEKEKEIDVITRKFRFATDFLSSRLTKITNSVLKNSLVREYPIVYFSSSTGTAAAIKSSLSNSKIVAIISRGGRVDLIPSKTIQRIQIPILFIVGELDVPIMRDSKNVLDLMIGTSLKELVIIRGASHYFEESGNLEELSNISLEWLKAHVSEKNLIFLNSHKQKSFGSFLNNFNLNLIIKFHDRRRAGFLLGEILKKHKNIDNSIILGIARGGVMVADGIVDKINSPSMDVIFIQRLRSPYNSEETIGALDLDNLIYLVPSSSKVPRVFLDQEIAFQNRELKRKLDLYKPYCKNTRLENKLVVIVDDGSNTGATLIAASRYVKKFRPHRILVAVPIIPSQITLQLAREVDALEYILSPNNFRTVEDYYVNFDQIDDEKVVSILKNRLPNI